MLLLDEETGFYKLSDSPDFLVTDFHITTRRMKEETPAYYIDNKKWVTTDFSPFIDKFDPAIEDTTPFAIDKEGTMLEHSIDETYRHLGGFHILLKID